MKTNNFRGDLTDTSAIKTLLLISTNNVAHVIVYTSHLQHHVSWAHLVRTTDVPCSIGMVGSRKMVDTSNSGTNSDSLDCKTLENRFPVPEKMADISNFRYIGVR